MCVELPETDMAVRPPGKVGTAGVLTLLVPIPKYSLFMPQQYMEELTRFTQVPPVPDDTKEDAILPMGRLTATGEWPIPAPQQYTEPLSRMEQA